MTVAAVLGFVVAALRVLAGTLQFLFASDALWGSPAFFYSMAALNLLVAPFLVWGAIAALKGNRADVLTLSALAVAVLDLGGLGVALANGGQTSTGAIGLILAVAIFRNMKTAEANEYFATSRASAGTEFGQPPMAPTALEFAPSQRTHQAPKTSPEAVRDELRAREGRPFGHYKLLDLIGRGGMGEVWRAFDTGTERVVAVKLLPTHLAHNTDFVERFRREAHAAAQLNSPHVIPIHTYGQLDGRLFVDMRLIAGQDLAKLIAEGPLHPVQAVRIIEQIAEALNDAHQIGLVHRDVKPSNILVDEEGFAYLIDFGIARGIDQTGMTVAGAIVGTLPYMAPERFRGQTDPRADVYALACVLHECLTGTKPFDGNSLPEQYVAHTTEPPPRPSIMRHDIPGDFDDVIAHGMAKDPDQRYRTTIALANDAARAVSVLAPPPHAPPARSEVPASAPPRRSQRAKILAAAAVATVVAVVVAGVVLYVHSGSGGSTLSKEELRALTKLPVSGGAVVIDAEDNVYVPASDGTKKWDPNTGDVTTVNLGAKGTLVADPSGTLYLVDLYSSPGRVVKVGAPPDTALDLPTTGLYAVHIAVDTSENVYATYQSSPRVVKLSPGANAPTDLPFTGMRYAGAIAVDNRGTVYVSNAASTANGVEGVNEVLQLAAGSNAQAKLPFFVFDPTSVAIDTSGAVYVTGWEDNSVQKLPADAATAKSLPVVGLDNPLAHLVSVAVDGKDNVYVVDSDTHVIWRLPAA